MAAWRGSRRLVEGAPAIDELPLDRFHGRGVVIDVDADDYGLVDLDALRDATPPIEAEDIVFLHSGWWRYADDERYHRHPSLTCAAAEWLVERGIKLLGIDFPTPDLALARREPGFDWPVHRTLLGDGVLIAENLRALDTLVGARIDAICVPLSIRGADGPPARILARPEPGEHENGGRR